VSYVEETLSIRHLLKEACERQKHKINMPIHEHAVPRYYPRKNMPLKYTTLHDLDTDSYERLQNGTVLRFKGPGTESFYGGRLNTGTCPMAHVLGEMWSSHRRLLGNSRLSQQEFKASYAILEYASLVKETVDGSHVVDEVKSKSKTRETKRISYIAEVPHMVRDEVSGEERSIVSLAEIESFFMIARVERSSQGKANNVVGDQKRFAVCHILDTSQEGTCHVLEYKQWKNAYLEKNKVISVRDIGRKVVGIRVTQEACAGEPATHRMVFKPHQTDYENIFSSD